MFLCRKRGSNPYNPCGSEDFKSSASANSVIPTIKKDYVTTILGILQVFH